METYKVFTARHRTVEDGAELKRFELDGAGVAIDAILVGEGGRGRKLGVLSVQGSGRTLCPHAGQKLNHRIYGAPDEVRKDKCQLCGTIEGWERDGEHRFHDGTTTPEFQAVHPNTGSVPVRLMAAGVGKARSGKPKLFAASQANNNEAAIVIMRTGMGYRGGNSHTGDIIGWECRCGAKGAEVERPEKCPGCGKEKDGGHWDHDRAITLIVAQFPGQVLAEGTIAQGDAGRMGHGQQYVVLMPKGVVFRTGFRGRLYGGPDAVYYVFDGERLLVATWEERMATDCF